MNNRIFTPLFYLLSLSLSFAQINPPNGVSCSGAETSFFYTDDFEYSSASDHGSNTLLGAGWTGDIDDHNSKSSEADPIPKNNKWGVVESNPRTGNTGPTPSVAQSGNRYLMYESNQGNTPGVIVSPEIDLSNVTEDLELSFWLYAFGADMGKLDVGLASTANGPFTNVWSLNAGYSEQAWKEVGIDLSAFVDPSIDKIFIEFNYDGGTGSKADIAIDFLRLETCGDVCVPGQVVFSNEQYNTVDFDWSPSGNQTNIQYSVSDANATSQEGTVVDLDNAANQTVTLSNLEKLTTYALWVRSECTSGFSEWEKFLFTTAEQYNYVVSPGEIITVNYCYAHNDGVVYTFQSDNGEPVELNFLEGTLYSTYTDSNRDKLIIKDGSSNVLEDGTGLPKVGDDVIVKGLRFLSDEVTSSDAISFEVDNYGFNATSSCSKRSLESIVVEATIKACDNKPEATYTTVKNCTDVSEAFFINVNIASFGDANALNIKNNIDGTVVLANQTDANYNYEIGPFSHNTNVKVTVEDAANSACFISSSSINISSCPPENDTIENAILVETKPLGDYSGDVVGTFYEATASESTIPSVSCNNGAYADDDVWFKFKPNHEVQYIRFQRANGNWNTTNPIQEYITSETPLEASLYRHVDGESFANIEEVFCFQNFANYGYGRPSLITPLLDLSENVTYYLRVYTLGQKKHDTQFDLAITGGETLDKFLIQNAAVVNFCDASTSGVYEFEAPSYNGFLNYLRPQNVSCEIEWFPNPTFMAFEVTESGQLDFKIEQVGDAQYQDFEYLVYGPYDNMETIYTMNIYEETVVKCGDGGNSYNFNLNAQAGKIYLVVGLNRSNAEQTYVLTQTNGANNEGEISGDPVVDFSSDPLVLDCVNTTITLEPDWTVSKNIVRYEWYNSDSQIIGTEKELSVSEPGNYALLAYNNCDVSDFATVEVLINEPELFAEVSTSDICGASGEAVFVITGANGAEVTYAIGNGSDQTLVLGLDPTSIAVQITENTTLFLKEITDGLCTETLTASAEAKLIPYTDLTPLSLGAICEGDPSPLPTTVDGYTGVWSPAYDATQTTTYTFTPDTVAGMCFNTLDVTVEVWDVVTPTFDALDAVCEGTSSPLPNVSNEGYSGVWTPSYDATQTQTYTFTADVQSGICFEQTSLTVIVNEEIEPTFDLDFSEPVCLNTNLEAFPSISNEGISGTWSPELDSSMAGEVTYYFTPDASFCAMETYVTVSYVQCEVPEGISPNGDAYNQYFDLSTFGVKRLEIYNRYGKLVYSRNNYKKEWYGQDSGNGALPVGTYFYIITFNDNSKSKTGSVYINR